MTRVAVMLPQARGVNVAAACPGFRSHQRLTTRPRRAALPSRPAATVQRSGAAAAASSRRFRCSSSLVTSVEGEPPQQRLEIPELPPKQKVYSHISNFANSDGVTASVELAGTLVVLAGTYAGALASFAQFSSGNLVLGAVGATAFCLICGLTKMRLFIQFHDMAHGSFFPNRNAYGRFANKGNALDSLVNNHKGIAVLPWH